MASEFQRQSRFFRLLLGAFALNVLLVGALWTLRKLPPTQNVKLSATPNFILFYGTNSLGFFSIRQYSSWEKAHQFLQDNNLKLPQITYTEIIKEPHVEVREQKIFWGAQNAKKVLYTPDAESARIVGEQLLYVGLQPSSFGYSILLKN